MKLSEEDGKRFYDIWLPLLDYVNEKGCKFKTQGHKAGRSSGS